MSAADGNNPPESLVAVATLSPPVDVDGQEAFDAATTTAAAAAAAADAIGGVLGECLTVLQAQEAAEAAVAAAMRAFAAEEASVDVTTAAAAAAAAVGSGTGTGSAAGTGTASRILHEEAQVEPQQGDKEGDEDEEEESIDQVTSLRHGSATHSLSQSQPSISSSAALLAGGQEEHNNKRHGRRLSLHMAGPATTTDTTTTGDPNVKQRRDHLQRLFYQRKLQAYMMESQATAAAASATAAAAADGAVAAAVTSRDGMPVQEVLQVDNKEQHDEESVIASHTLLNSIAMQGLIGDSFLDDKEELVQQVIMKDAAGKVDDDGQPTTSAKQYSDNIRQIQLLCKDLLEKVSCFSATSFLPVEIRINDFSYLVRVEQDESGGSNSKIPTVYTSSPLYPLYKLLQRVWRGEKPLLPPKRFHQKHILSNISLFFVPGKSYLVLGPPGSGKTTLLKAIAGRIHCPSSSSSSSSSSPSDNNDNTTSSRHIPKEVTRGNIYYNGRTLHDDASNNNNGGARGHRGHMKKKEFHMENVIHYIDQLDLHAPRLTVQETFDFAYQCKSAGKTLREADELIKTEEERRIVAQADADKLRVQIGLIGLGLQGVKDTFVGDTNVRGVSGGQRRRVTVGEMLMERTPVLCGDEVSTGLDAASTYTTVELLLHFARNSGMTRVISLLQPSPETVSLFDQVILLGEGRVVYAGPIEMVEDYFARLGYLTPEFMDVADFLQQVSTDDGKQFYHPPDDVKEIRPVAPTVSELADIFAASELGRDIQEQLNAPFSWTWANDDRNSGHGSMISGIAKTKAVQRKYANRFARSTILILKRFLKLWRRDSRVIIAAVVKNVLMGVSVGGVFANTTNEISTTGALFQGGLFIMLCSMQSASAFAADRAIFYKHTDANFYSAWPFVFGRTLAGAPQTICDVLIFGTLMYYIIGLADRTDAANFFIYLSLLICFALCMQQQLSVFASFASESKLQVYSAIILLLFILFGGYIIAPDTIADYYIWVYWWNPFAWAYRGLIVNEFRSGKWPNPDESLELLGFVDAAGVPFAWEWVGWAFCYMLLYFLLCCVLTALGLTYLRPADSGGGKPEPDSPSLSAPGNEDKNKGDDSKAGEQGEKENKAVQIPFMPVDLSFHDITYEVVASTSTETLRLLKSVNGIFRAGRMCALMGSSGAGKTTLMDVIALRKRSGTITGEVRLNGWLQDPISFRRASGYVEQFDVQSPELSVRETVLFSAQLRLDSSVAQSKDAVSAFVDGVLKEVELDSIADALVGSAEEGGLSFEQKKRLSIAVELGASPSIIFLDEPTSGLDARSALLVVKTLRKLANGGRTVCATIHQPSSTVFAMFDDLLLLRKGGEVVFAGPTGDCSSSLVNYFESLGAPNINIGENPANWMLQVITSDEMGDLAQKYLESTNFVNLKQDLDGLRNGEPDPAKKIQFEDEFAASKTTRGKLVSRRLRLIYWRSPTYSLSRLTVSAAIAFVLGSAFLTERNTPDLTESEMRARLGVLFLSFIITGIMGILSVIPVMTRIRDMYYRQRDAGMYDSLSIGWALASSEKPYIVLSTTIFTLVFLGTSGMNAKIYTGLIGYWGFFTFNFAMYSYFGQAFVCLVKPSATAIILSSVFIGLNNFFAGLIVRPQFMVGTFFAIPYYICPGHYVYEGLVVSLFHKDMRTVLADPQSEFYDYLVSIGTCTPGASCTGTVNEFVDVFFGFEYSFDHVVGNALVLGLFLVIARLMSFCALKYIRFS